MIYIEDILCNCNSNVKENIYRIYTKKSEKGVRSGEAPQLKPPAFVKPTPDRKEICLLAFQPMGFVQCNQSTVEKAWGFSLLG